MQEVRFSPTHDIEASLLNIVKHRWPQASKILDLREDVFVDEDHKKLFQLFRTTQAENGLWDDNILRGKFEEMGGNLSTYNRVSVIANNPSNTDEYISQIIKGAKDRRLLEYLIHAQKSKDEPIDILKSAMEDLSQLDGMRQARVRGATIDEVAERFRNKEFPPKISSGIDTIDKLLGGISPEEVTTLGAPPGTGKAEDINTLIPTPNGFTKMGDIAIGDKVFDENGNICTVIGATPIMEGRPCYRITFSDGTEVICDALHQWLTRDEKARQSTGRKERYRNEKGQVKKFGTDQSYKKTYPHAVTTEYISQTLRYGKDNRINHAVKNCQPINLPFLPLPIDPYVLGSWCGDGDSNGGGMTGVDEEILDEIRRAGYSVNKRKTKYRYGILGLTSQLREIGVLNDKHIPSIYLRASYEQRLSLLQGLMDTDGHCNTQGTCEFVSMKENLARQVKELVCSLGIKATFRIGDAKLNGISHGPKYRVCFTTNKQVFRLSRKQSRVNAVIRDTQNYRYIVSCEPIESVPVRCIEVDSPSHLFLCTESFIPTHNSILAATIAANIAMDGGTSLIFSKEMLEEKIFSRLVATYSQERVGLYEDIKRGKVQGKEASSEVRKSLETIITMLANLRDYFMFFDMEDSPRMSPHEISEEIRAQNSVLAQWNKSNPHLMPRKIDFVVVDYLQILDYDKGNGSTSDDLDSLAKGLHDVALQQHCHILVLAAVNRALGKSLDLDAFRGSAGIGFNTDNALLMVANDDLNLSGLGSDWTGEYPKCKALTIHVAKARSGQTNARGYLKFSGLYQSFEEFEAQELAGLKAILGDEGSKQKREKIM